MVLVPKLVGKEIYIYIIITMVLCLNLICFMYVSKYNLETNKNNEHVIVLYQIYFPIQYNIDDSRLNPVRKTRC